MVDPQGVNEANPAVYTPGWCTGAFTASYQPVISQLTPFYA